MKKETKKLLDLMLLGFLLFIFGVVTICVIVTYAYLFINFKWITSVFFALTFVLGWLLLKLES